MFRVIRHHESSFPSSWRASGSTAVGAGPADVLLAAVLGIVACAPLAAARRRGLPTKDASNLRPHAFPFSTTWAGEVEEGCSRMISPLVFSVLIFRRTYLSRVLFGGSELKRAAPPSNPVSG